MKQTILLFIAACILSACSSTNMESVWAKENFTGKQVSKVAVIAVSKDFQVRTETESAIVAKLEAKGINAIAGTSFLGLNATKADWETENIAKKLENLGVDTAIGISLINVRDVTEYEPGMSYSYPSGYYRYGRYIYQNYNHVYSPGYYVETQEYVIESNIYDVMVASDKENALLWRGQSVIHSPSSLNQAARSNASNLVNYITKNNIISQKK